MLPFPASFMIGSGNRPEFISQGRNKEAGRNRVRKIILVVLFFMIFQNGLVAAADFTRILSVETCRRSYDHEKGGIHIAHSKRINTRGDSSENCRRKERGPEVLLQ